MLLSVISGTFNEAGNVPEFVARVVAAVQAIPDCDYEILILSLIHI